MVRFANRFHASFRTFFNIQNLLTCQIKILIVIDDEEQGGFGDDIGFHLGQVLKILDNDPWSHVEFQVTKAHRQASPDPAVLSNFRFDADDLTRFDQIWLFGILKNQDPLSEQELEALSRFMDGGGGVFAAGDHENLGFAMCGKVPRVRSMRRWHHTLLGPASGPQSPRQDGPGRHDTLVVPPGGGTADQSDMVPQRIRPRFYIQTLNSGIIQRAVKYPHPVLCGPAGVIEYLPDHMHEGLCEVPDDLAQTFTFGGHTLTEYPTVNGHQEIPEVIAWAESHNTDATEFGVLATYDGHRVGVGRVLVDASWHHWFNVNFVGFLAATDPQSPSYDPQVVPQWEAIKAYFYNVGLWLARKSTQSLLRNGGLLLASRSNDVLMTWREISEVQDPASYFWQLGTIARESLGRVVSQCQIVLWLTDLLSWTGLPLDPWQPAARRSQPAPRTWIDDEQLALVGLGGAIHALLAAFGKEIREGAQPMLDRKGKDIEDAIQRGSAGAVNLLIRQTQEGTAALQPLAERAATVAGLT